jgi:hypothetical protein
MDLIVMNENTYTRPKEFIKMLFIQIIYFYYGTEFEAQSVKISS